MIDYAAEYDNGRKVPNWAELVGRWTDQSAAFRATHPHSELDLRYGPSERQGMDIFWPGTARDVPVAMFIHGGYWQRTHRHNYSCFAQGLLAHGIAVAMPSHDLCPAVTLDALVDQVRAAAATLRGHIGRGFMVTGHSAGGHLTAMLMATDWTARGITGPVVTAGMPISGLFDLPPVVQSGVIAVVGLDNAAARRQSPVLLPPPAMPLHATVGGDEGAEYTRQSRDLAHAWRGTWESLPGLNHFTILAQLADPGSTLVARARGLCRPT